MRLRTDPTQATYDRYGRLLAYVDLVGGGSMNANMIRAGWANVYVYNGVPFQRVRLVPACAEAGPYGRPRRVATLRRRLPPLPLAGQQQHAREGRDHIVAASMPVPILLDCDPGHDDAVAILLAAGNDAVDLRAITTVAGNCPLDLATRNARRVAALAGLDVPIAAGAAGPRAGELVTASDIHGETGLDGHDLHRGGAAGRAHRAGADGRHAGGRRASRSRSSRPAR